MATVPSIANTDRIADYTASAAQTDFTIPWPVIADSQSAAVSDFQVTVNDVSVAPGLMSFSGIAVAGVSGIWAGGTLTIPACSAGQRVIICSERDPRRTGNFLEGKTLPFTVLDLLMDDFAIMLRDIDLRMKRALLLSTSDYLDGADPNTLATDVVAAKNAAVAAAATASGAAGTVGSGASLWQRPAKSIQTSPPGGPATGDRYLVAHSGTSGGFVGKEDNVAEWNGAIWIYSGAPQVNQILELGTTTYRYSQESFDSGVAWHPAWISAGGPRGFGQPSDQPAAIEAISQSPSRVANLSVTSIGAAPILHFNTCGGTYGAPSLPLNGANLGSIGYRPYATTPGSFLQSVAAIQVYATENVASGGVCGTKMIFETSINTGGAFNGRNPVFGLENNCALFYGTAGTSVGPNLSGSGSHRGFFGNDNTAGGFMQSDSNVALFLNRNGSDGTSLEFRKSTSTVGSISVTGAATAYNTTCDARLKTKLGNLDSGLIIDSVSPHAFEWNKTGLPDFGFFAQELHGTYSNAVKVGSGAEMSPDDEGFEPWQVDNSKLVPILWAEIKALRQRVAALEKR